MIIFPLNKDLQLAETVDLVTSQRGELVQKELDLREKVIMKLAEHLSAKCEVTDTFACMSPTDLIQQAVKELK